MYRRHMYGFIPVTHRRGFGFAVSGRLLGRFAAGLSGWLLCAYVLIGASYGKGEHIKTYGIPGLHLSIGDGLLVDKRPVGGSQVPNQ